MIVDVRKRLTQSTFGNLPKPAGKICPHCGCQAKAQSSPREHGVTYFYFECGAPSYKQSRSQDAIALLREHGPVESKLGCESLVPSN